MGGTSDQAVTMGILTGAAEVVFEKLGIGRLSNALFSGKTTLVKTILKGMVEEGLEEMGTTTANLLADSLIMGGLSQINTAVEAYMAYGMSQNAAYAKAVQGMAGQLGLSGLAGMIAGGVMDTTAGGINYLSTMDERLGKGASTLKHPGWSGTGLVNEGYGSTTAAGLLQPQFQTQPGQAGQSAANGAEALRMGQSVVNGAEALRMGQSVANSAETLKLGLSGQQAVSMQVLDKQTRDKIAIEADRQLRQANVDPVTMVAAVDAVERLLAGQGITQSQQQQILKSKDANQIVTRLTQRDVSKVETVSDFDMKDLLNDASLTGMYYMDILKGMSDNVGQTYNQAKKGLQDITEGARQYLKGRGTSFKGGSRAKDGINGEYSPDNVDNNGNSGVETGGQGGIINEETITNKEQVVPNQDGSSQQGAEGAGDVGKVITEIKYKPSSGVNLKANPIKTTTVLGSFEKDMKNIVNEMGNVKSTYFGAKKGGFNVLNVPDDMYKDADQFWYEVNIKWLDEAISRGDDIVLATKPEGKYLYKFNAKTHKRKISGFGREYNYLKKNGYVYDYSMNTMIRR